MIDLLAITAHPDDLEICVSGIFLKAKKAGKKTGLIVCTKGESGGNAEQSTRITEGEAAARLLGLDYFKMLSFGDSDLFFERELRDALIPLIRECSPRIVLTLHPDDYHPDHVAVSRTVDAVTFVAGLKKYSADNTDWHPEQVLYFTADLRTNGRNPDVLIDVSDVIVEKGKCTDAHKSQCITNFSIELARYFGILAGCKYAEGLYTRRPLILNSVEGLFSKGAIT